MRRTITPLQRDLALFLAVHMSALLTMNNAFNPNLYHHGQSRLAAG